MKVLLLLLVLATAYTQTNEINDTVPPQLAICPPHPDGETAEPIQDSLSELEEEESVSNFQLFPRTKTAAPKGDLINIGKRDGNKPTAVPLGGRPTTPSSGTKLVSCFQIDVENTNIPKAIKKIMAKGL